MGIKAGIFADGAGFEEKYVKDYDYLSELVTHLRGLNLKIALTSGTFDLLHIGHAEYLKRAKEFANVLVVGVDSDEKVKKRKGPNRPIVSEDERLRVLSHIGHVDILVLKKSDDPKLHLLKTVRPDVLVVSETTGHDDGNIESMKEFCGRIEVLEPQSETSTTAKIRRLHIDGIGQFIKELNEFMERKLNKLGGLE